MQRGNSRQSTIERPRYGGDKSSRATQDARMSTALQLVAEGLPRQQAIEEFRKKHGAVPLRTIDEYRAKALMQLRVARESERAHDLEVRIHRLTHLSSKYEREGASSAVMQAESLLAKITGLLQPDRHLHLHTPNQPAQAAPVVQYQGMADQDLDSLESALRAVSVAGAIPPLRALPDGLGGAAANYGDGSSE